MFTDRNCHQWIGSVGSQEHRLLFGFLDWFRGSRVEDEGNLEQTAQAGNAIRKRIGNMEEGVHGKTHKLMTVTDQHVLQKYFRSHDRNVHPVATASFLEKSKEQYNAQWLAREIVQNFVDHNPHHPGTLDGVQVKMENASNGKKRFTIVGKWPFRDATGLISPHSEKPKGKKTAGGNGIGLKQVAIRLMRDFHVTRFDVYGEEWCLKYDMVRAEDVNRELAQSGSGDLVQHDWLTGEQLQAKQKGVCGYLIETDDPELIAALTELPTLGVSAANPYLQNADFQSPHGSLKWLTPSKADPQPKGRLFLNGQVMQYSEKGKPGPEYWRGPECVTIELKDVDYKMSIDRPPVDSWYLDTYVETMIKAMTAEQIIEQLKRSAHLWNQRNDRYPDEGWLVMVKKLARELVSYTRMRKNQYDPASFTTIFGSAYLCRDKELLDVQEKELLKQGYLLCPAYLLEIGMPRASEKLDSVDQARTLTPQQPDLASIAKEKGLLVAGEQVSAGTPDALYELMRRRLRSYDCVMEEAADTPSVFRLRLPIDIPPELLSHPLPEAKRGERGQECLHFLRGAVLEGLRRKFIGRAFSMQGKLATTYAADYDIVMNKNVLLVRNIECSTAEGFVLELEVPPEHMETFRAAFLEAAPHTPEGTTASSVDGIPDPTDKTAPPSAPDTTRKIPTPETTPAAPVPPLDLHVDGPQRIADGVNAAINAIPVQQPDAPATDPAGRVILRDALAPDSDPKQVGAILDAIPGVAEAIRQLDAVTPKTEIPGGGDNDPLKQYAQWRNDLEHFYGQASQDAGYLTGTHLAEILGRMDRAAIDNVVAKPDEKNSPEDTALLHMRQLRSALGSLIERLAPPNDEIQDFELVLSPTEIQLSKLSMLRLYLRLTTDAILPNDLFVYTGTGSKGINIAQKAIGLHAELLNVSFQEALRTMVHEVAHNAAMDHENHFRHTMEALFATIIQRLSTIARTPAEKRTEADKAILELEQKWDATSEEGRRDQV